MTNVKCNVQTETINTVVASVELANGCKILLYFGIVGVKFGHHWHFAEGVVVALFVHGLVAIDKVPIIVFAVFAVFYHVLENGVVVTGVVEHQVHYYFDIHCVRRVHQSFEVGKTTKHFVHVEVVVDIVLVGGNGWVDWI